MADKSLDKQMADYKEQLAALKKQRDDGQISQAEFAKQRDQLQLGYDPRIFGDMWSVAFVAGAATLALIGAGESGRVSETLAAPRTGVVGSSAWAPAGSSRFSPPLDRFTHRSASPEVLPVEADEVAVVEPSVALPLSVNTNFTLAIDSTR